ncbi:MAG: TetR/AcrR family transcriptional regulator [Lachnospiraceae bacterium]|nr:TetR/AcrR family transcriptional regulator [Lachnospiraceae bacterium]
MSKVEQNKLKKRTALLDNAFELFTSKGLNSTSISDIVSRAGVAKGTFYLYFKDKYDIHNRLIARKTANILLQATGALHEHEDIISVEDKIIFLTDYVISLLEKDKTLLTFISKNLSWGIFKNVLINSKEETDVDFRHIFLELFRNSDITYRNPEVLVFIIIELISSTAYSSILYNEPIPIDELKPYLDTSIRQIMKGQEI